MESSEVTVLLERIRARQSEQVNKLMHLVYNQLRQLAHSHLRGQDQTMQATALVNEAYVKMVEAMG